MNKFTKVKIAIGNELYFIGEVINSKENSIEYTDDSSKNKIEIVDDKIIYTRENNEFLLVMDNTKEYAYYKLKDLNYELDIKINYLDKRIEDNKLIISYLLETTDKEINIILEGDK